MGNVGPKNERSWGLVPCEHAASSISVKSSRLQCFTSLWNKRQLRRLWTPWRSWRWTSLALSTIQRLRNYLGHWYTRGLSTFHTTIYILRSWEGWNLRCILSTGEYDHSGIWQDFNPLPPMSLLKSILSFFLLLWLSLCLGVDSVREQHRNSQFWIY